MPEVRRWCRREEDDPDSNWEEWAAEGEPALRYCHVL